MDSHEMSMLKSLLDSAVMSIDSSHAKADELLSDLLATLMKLRGLRNKIFPEGYFADTAWDILLDLYEAHNKNTVLCTTSLAVDAKTPLATLLRYLGKLEKDEYIERFNDDIDRRRTMVRLTHKGIQAMDDIFCNTAEKTNGITLGPANSVIANMDMPRTT